MLIRVMLCFLGKVEGVSRGIAVLPIVSGSHAVVCKSSKCTSKRAVKARSTTGRGVRRGGVVLAVRAPCSSHQLGKYAHVGRAYIRDATEHFIVP